ncbi:DUF2263 domain-containing protein [Balamuthia mandrillaris]
MEAPRERIDEEEPFFEIISTEEYKSKTIAEKDECPVEPIPEEWYEPEQVSSRTVKRNVTAYRFDAQQWLRAFKRVTEPSFVEEKGRHIRNRALHALRQIILYFTMRYVRLGAYPLFEEGKVVLLNRAFLLKQVARSRLYHSAPPFEQSLKGKYETKVTVFEGDCIKAALYLKTTGGLNPLVLNMANAHNPGGGYLNGDGAQEENLHRRTNYFQALEDPDRVYRDHRGWSYPIPPAGAIYSPNLLVFRGSEDEGYPLLSLPHLLSFIACAAVRKPRLLTNTNKERIEGPFRMDEDSEEEMREKIETILSVGLEKGHNCVVLSAFGCGAFGCPPYQVAAMFKRALESERYRGCYKHVAFAIFNDHNANRMHNPEGNILPFARVFGVEAQPIPSNL